MSQKSYIAHTTLSKCTFGSNENFLNLPVDHGVIYTTSDLPLMNANDHTPNVHILSYGTCKSTKGPCIPQTPLAWVNANDKHLLDGAPALLECSKLPCMLGGIISIIPPPKEESSAEEES